VKRLFDICSKCKSFETIETITTTYPPRKGKHTDVSICCRKSTEFPIFCNKKEMQRKINEKFEQLDIPEDCLMKTEYSLIEWNE